MNLTYRQHMLLLAALKVFEDVRKYTSPPETKKEINDLIYIVQEHAMMRKRADERLKND